MPSVDPQNDPRPGDLVSGLLRKILNRLANISSVAVGYTPENVANKSNDETMPISTTLYPTTQAVFGFSGKRLLQVGTVKLTAGAGSFTVAGIVSGCVVLLSHSQIIGTAGHLACVITDGVGVAVSSTSATDASYVNYAVTYDYS